MPLGSKLLAKKKTRSGANFAPVLLLFISSQNWVRAWEPRRKRNEYASLYQVRRALLILPNLIFIKNSGAIALFSFHPLVMEETGILRNLVSFSHLC